MNFLILSRNRAKEFSCRKQAYPYIIISITDVGAERVGFRKNVFLKDVLRVSFEDVDTDGVHAITDDDARKIVRFVNKWKKQVELIVIHCEAGMSRSAGVCAALMLWINGSDEFIFGNPFYKPNMKCYRTVLNQIQQI